MKQTEGNISLSFERIVFFSDAVFAIVITLLVLEIKVPHLEGPEGSGMSDALVHLLPKFLGFICSFLIVGLMWFEHHRIFRYIDKFSAGLVWRNLVFLLFISFIPFPTALFSEYPLNSTAFMGYVLIFALAAAAKLWVWTYAVRQGLLAESFSAHDARRISRRSLGVPVGCLVCFVLALFLPPYLSFFGFPLIPLVASLLDPGKSPKMEPAE